MRCGRGRRGQRCPVRRGRRRPPGARKGLFHGLSEGAPCNREQAGILRHWPAVPRLIPRQSRPRQVALASWPVAALRVLRGFLGERPVLGKEQKGDSEGEHQKSRDNKQRLGSDKGRQEGAGHDRWGSDGDTPPHNLPIQKPGSPVLRGRNQCARNNRGKRRRNRNESGIAQKAEQRGGNRAASLAEQAAQKANRDARQNSSQMLPGQWNPLLSTPCTARGMEGLCCQSAARRSSILPGAAGGRFGAGVLRATACVRGGRIRSLQPQVLEHLQRLLSADIRRSDPAADSFGLQMA